MNIFAKDGAQIVPVAKPLVCRKCFELNLKLLKVKMRAKKVVINLWLLYYEYFTNSEFGKIT